MKMGKYILGLLVAFILCHLESTKAEINSKEEDAITQLPGLDKSVPFKQYSGFLDGGGGKQLHYWLVESERSPSSDPLVLWLNGGPGCSSMTGMLEENGPFRVDKNGRTLFINPYSWNKISNVLYLESPVGVGFSYSASKNYTANDITTRDQNYQALKSFFQKFPEYQGREFFITGESYAGVYVPMLAATVVDDPSINLKGYAVGNGMLHQELLDSSLVYFEYYHGLIDNKMWRQLIQECCDGDGVNRCMFAAEAKQKPTCQKLVGKAIDRAWYGGVNVYGMYGPCEGGAPTLDTVLKSTSFRPLLHPGLMPETLSGKADIMKILKSASRNKRDTADNVEEVVVAYTPCTDSSHVSKWISSEQVQEALHVKASGVGKHESCSSTVSAQYTKQIFDLTPQILKTLDKGLRVLIYNGDTDMACNFLGDEWFVEGLGRRQLAGFRAWFSPDDRGVEQVAGFSRQFDGIAFVTVKGSGHYVPKDKPKESFEMYHRFLNNISF